jgi:hypothetical protein
MIINAHLDIYTLTSAPLRALRDDYYYVFCKLWLIPVGKNCINAEIAEKEEGKNSQCEKKGYDFNCRIGDKNRVYGIKDLARGHIGVYSNTQPHNAYIFLAFPAVTKLPGINGKRILIVYQVVPDILIIRVDIFQFFQIFIQPYAFSLHLFPGVHAILSHKKGK